MHLVRTMGEKLEPGVSNETFKELDEGFRKKSRELMSNQGYWKIRGGKYRGSPDSTVFALPGNRTIEKTILFGD